MDVRLKFASYYNKGCYPQQRWSDCVCTGGKTRLRLLAEQTRQQVGTKPSNFEPRVFAMIESLSRNVVLPIAGIILTFIACYELIEMITQHNNMAQFEPAIIMRWIFKTAVSVWLISNTFDIVMAVFDLTQKVVSDSSGIIAGNTRINS